MDIESRISLIKQVGEEIVTEEELKKLLETKTRLIAYDGFEPSGNVHIAQGLMRAINVNKMIKAGCHFKMYVADWHAWANNKISGNLENIQTVGQYLIEVWKVCGMDLKHVDFIWANDIVADRDYWKIVMQVARKSTINRIIRCGQTIGRKDKEMQNASQIIYPCMQAADIFYLKTDICQLGMDQRKVNILARELAPDLGFAKPVIVSHHMLLGLGKPATQIEDRFDRILELKMSKSKPESAIFMTDTEEDIMRKITYAYCPPKIIEDNPIAEYLKYIIFEKFDEIEIKRDVKYGGNIAIKNYEEFVKLYSEGKIHPADLKSSVSFYINKLVEPVRDHFKTNKKAKELLEKVESFPVTR